MLTATARERDDRPSERLCTHPRESHGRLPLIGGDAANSRRMLVFAPFPPRGEGLGMGGRVSPI
ncbi:MAG: hypothetical protein ACT4QC_04440 [Planctomycetaceae bacterium]